MSRENFCHKVDCPFWNSRNSSCDRFTTAHQCPIWKELPPDTYDPKLKSITDSYATQYALYWDDRCLPFDRLEGKLMSFLIGDRHYQQLAYLSKFEDPSTYTLRRRIDSGVFFRAVKIKPSLVRDIRDRVASVCRSWYVANIKDPNICTIAFPVQDFVLFESCLEAWEEVSDE